MNANQRALIYARVSSHEQGKGYSITTQLEQCRAYCQQRHYVIVGESIDEFTGTESDRPGIARLYDLVAEHHPDVVLAYDVDRLLGRDLLAQALIKGELEGADTRIEYVLGGGSDSADGGLLEEMKMLWARHENRQRVERSRRGKRGRAQAGQVMVCGSRAPFGYDYISEPHKGRLEINEAEAEVVRDIFRWLVHDGMSSYAIARELWEKGILTKGDYSEVVFKKAGRGEWSATTVRRIIANPLYKGEWYFGTTRRVKRNQSEKPWGGAYATKVKQIRTDPSEWVRVDVPAIVTPELWDRAQEQLKVNRANATRNAKRQYLLRGMVFCTCGRRWTGRYKKHVDKAYYRCPSTEAEYWRAPCDCRFSIRQDSLEPVVWNRVVNYLLHPEVMMADVERRRAEQSQAHVQYERKLRAIDSGMSDVDRKLAQLLDQALEGFPGDIIEAKRRELSERREALVAERRRLEAEQADVTVSPDTEATLREIAATVKTALPLMTFEEQRRILEILRVRVDVIDKETIRLSGLLNGSIVNISYLSAP